ncbi:hydrogenase maturation nickel metallochaperone HypA [Conexibacter stalactiti]|uniref:Hydrogenase maturation factor HypA n=1 Tax=Conexibacter stalactiti TaxID=1940611 RepID=A0ABU4HP88_9ACTN|nr:hydrogenase maturation nickel metallochaperone HypA [Conexibacter stalactiti]MDW5593869.1 hydrogenase maturation nickel metallochaperone HypA [Conexibacter stalactiti]MEC5034511.1 hydrogenase maturation nickel metallochaperone HypA [Conexibacter stalactiti]
MHELSIGSAVLDTVVRHAAGRRVEVVYLRVGALRQVVPESLAFWFGLLARETVCEGARLEQELVPARLRCDGCATAWAAEVPAFRCPACGGAAVAVEQGEELEVESIDVQEARCTA